MPISIEKYRSPAAPNFYTVSSLSAFMLPGLGQIRAGEPRKGLIFITAHIFNLTFLAFILFLPALTAGLTTFSSTYNLKLNQPLTLSLQELGRGSPLALFSALLFFSFALFAAYDAYYQKLKVRRQAIYKGYFVAMPEAVSSSYICHATFLITCLILAFFFLVPLAPPQQITDIEFVQNQETTKERPLTQKRAEHNARAAGKLDQSKPLDSAKAAPKSAQAKSAPAKSTPAKSTPPKSTPPKSAQAKSTQIQPPTNKPVAALPVPHPLPQPDQPNLKPVLKPLAAPTPMPATALPTPVNKPITALTPGPQPTLTTVQKISSAPLAVQLPRLSSAAVPLPVISVPNPKANSALASGAVTPQPLSLNTLSTAAAVPVTRKSLCILWQLVILQPAYQATAPSLGQLAQMRPVPNVPPPEMAPG